MAGRFECACAIGRCSALAALIGRRACTSIQAHQGYLADEVLLQSVQPGVDNRISVERTLGQPSFISQFGEPVWYYVSSTTSADAVHHAADRRARPCWRCTSTRPATSSASSASGIEQVARINPESDETPTLGRDRSFFQDLFGNIGPVGTPGAGGARRAAAAEAADRPLTRAGVH